MEAMMKEFIKCYELSDEVKSTLLNILSSDFVPLISNEDITDLIRAEEDSDHEIFDTISIVNIPSMYNIDVVLMYGKFGDSCTNVVKETLSSEAVLKYMDIMETINCQRYELYNNSISLDERIELGIVTAISLSLGHQILKDNASHTVINQLFRTVLSDSSGSMYDTAKLIFDPKIVPNQKGLNLANMFMVLSNVSQYFDDPANEEMIRSIVPGWNKSSLLKYEVMTYMITSITSISYFTNNFRTNSTILKNVIVGAIILATTINSIGKHIQGDSNGSHSLLKKISGIRRTNSTLSGYSMESMDNLESIVYAVASSPPKMDDIALTNMNALARLIFDVESVISKSLKDSNMDEVKMVCRIFLTISRLIMTHCDIDGEDDIAKLHELNPMSFLVMKEIFTNSDIDTKTHYIAAKKIIKAFSQNPSFKLLSDNFGDNINKWNDAIDEAMILIINYTSFVEIMSPKDIVMVLTEDKGYHTDLELGKLCSKYVIGMKNPTSEILNRYTHNDSVLYNIIVNMMKMVSSEGGSNKPIPPFKDEYSILADSGSRINTWAESDIENGNLNNLLKPTTFRNKKAPVSILTMTSEIRSLIEEREDIFSALYGFSNKHAQTIDTAIQFRIMVIEALILIDVLDIFKDDEAAYLLEKVFRIMTAIDFISLGYKYNNVNYETETQASEKIVYTNMTNLNARLFHTMKTLLQFLVSASDNNIMLANLIGFAIMCDHMEALKIAKSKKVQSVKDDFVDLRTMISDGGFLDSLGETLRTIIKNRSGVWNDNDRDIDSVLNKIIKVTPNINGNIISNTFNNFWYPVKSFVIGEDVEMTDVNNAIQSYKDNIFAVLHCKVKRFESEPMTSIDLTIRILERYYNVIGVLTNCATEDITLFTNKRYVATCTFP
jgi:hypothetical protein